MNKQYTKEVVLTGRNVGVNITQLMNNVVIPASGASMVEIDASSFDECQIFIGTSSTFSIQAYPKFTLPGDSSNLVAGTSIIVIASNVAAPTAGRTFSYKLNANSNNVFPCKTLRFMVNNNDSVNPNTVNLWIVIRNA